MKIYDLKPIKFIPRWLYFPWYKYLFAKKSPDYNWFEVIKCRYKGHPNGVIWYNMNKLEPDMICRGCGDDLG